ncbi:uncharacterized protein LOC108136188 isoform X2 [Drosophila elegans]|uniref:uncharacterized protein LOC108136188 isoform X2 n=1 Tax=Drosophila elegans TaxID=30023 RepID=UPI0007E86172|nr:uncharacterized protein LOC108136188 isoform X2 [Drosophila elegans]
MQINQLDEQDIWFQSALGMREETFSRPWNYSFRVPSDPVQLFKWLLTLKLPMLEEETPPWSFYFDLWEAKDIELNVNVISGMLLVSLACQTIDVPSTPDDVKPSTFEKDMVTSQRKLTSPYLSTDDKISPRSSLVDVATGPDEPPVVPKLVEKGTGPEVIASPHGDPKPKPRSFYCLMKKAVLALSLLHTLYVLIQIAFGSSLADVWEAIDGYPTPPQIEETGWSVASMLEALLGALRSLMP